MRYGYDTEAPFIIIQMNYAARFTATVDWRFYPSFPTRKNVIEGMVKGIRMLRTVGERALLYTITDDAHDFHCIKIPKHYVKSSLIQPRVCLKFQMPLVKRFVNKYSLYSEWTTLKCLTLYGHLERTWSSCIAVPKDSELRVYATVELLDPYRYDGSRVNKPCHGSFHLPGTLQPSWDSAKASPTPRGLSDFDRHVWRS